MDVWCARNRMKLHEYSCVCFARSVLCSCAAGQRIRSFSLRGGHTRPGPEAKRFVPPRRTGLWSSARARVRRSCFNRVSADAPNVSLYTGAFGEILLGTLLCALAKKYTYIGYMGSVEMCEGVRSDRE